VPIAIQKAMENASKEYGGRKFKWNYFMVSD